MPPENDYAAIERLVHALVRPDAFPHPAADPVCVETHISWVILAGDLAYKLKKPLELGFLDFSTAARRREACAAEVRLNRRHAPELYLDVVAVTGPRETPRIDAEGEALEWAVRMRRFDREQELDRLVARDGLPGERIDELARTLARFHDETTRADAQSSWGTAEAVLAPCIANFERLGAPGEAAETSEQLASLRAWTLAEHVRLLDVFATRRAQGHVRECHGDLHLANIVIHDGRVVPFDCIEFSESLRWIDVAAEIAFTLMDLRYRQRPDLAQRLLDGYLAASGDYGLLTVLDFYLVYRAMVRAKVAAIRAGEPDLDAPARAAAIADFRAHVALAATFTAPRPRAVVVTHGVSGSGKSFTAARLVESGTWVRVRSDVERKRLAGVTEVSTGSAGLAPSLYSQELSDHTYAALAVAVETIVAAGYPVIVDAAFLERARREDFRALAARLGVPFAILACTAPRATLEARLTARAAHGGDPSDADVAVMRRQLAGKTMLEADELVAAVEIDAGAEFDADAVAQRLACVLGHGGR
jgi:hypothetical protein